MTDSTDEKPKKRKAPPYLPLELDAFEDAAKAARKAGVHEDVIMAGLPRMWLHCWRKKTDRVRPEDLDQFFTGADEKLRRALATTGFIAIDGDPAGDRVKGAARLLRISASKARGGHAAKGNLRRGSAPPRHMPETVPASSPAEARLFQPTASSQQPTDLPPPPLASEGGGSGKAPRAPRVRSRLRVVPDPEPAPPETPAQLAWAARLQAMRLQGAAYAVSHLERARADRLEVREGVETLVVRVEDPFFAGWLREHYFDTGLVARTNTGPPIVLESPSTGADTA